MTDGEEEPDDGRGDGRREGYDEDEIRLPTRMMPAMQFGQWVPVRIGHYAPPASFGHAMCLCGTDVFVYGGRTRDDALDTFHSFPGAPVPWRSVPYDGDGPGARVSHAMLMLEHYMYVLGGGGGNRSFNDLRRLDLYTMHWEPLETKGGVCSPLPPPPFHHHHHHHHLHLHLHLHLLHHITPTRSPTR